MRFVEATTKGVADHNKRVASCTVQMPHDSDEEPATDEPARPAAEHAVLEETAPTTTIA